VPSIEVSHSDDLPQSATAKRRIAVITGANDKNIFKPYAKHVDILIYDSVASLEYAIVILYMPMLRSHFLDASRAMCHLITVSDYKNRFLSFGEPTILPSAISKPSKQHADIKQDLNVSFPSKFKLC
jgi:hypothetical protein